jgi:hypothetical protein
MPNRVRTNERIIIKFKTENFYKNVSTFQNLLKSDNSKRDLHNDLLAFLPTHEA